MIMTSKQIARDLEWEFTTTAVVVVMLTVSQLIAMNSTAIISLPASAMTGKLSTSAEVVQS